MKYHHLIDSREKNMKIGKREAEKAKIKDENRENKSRVNREAENRGNTVTLVRE